MADRSGQLQATFTKWFREQLRQRGLSQEGAARQLDVSLATIRSWSGGKVTPSFDALVKIKKAWKVLPPPLG